MTERVLYLRRLTEFQYTGGRLVLDLQGDDEEETKAKGMCSSGICFALQDHSCTPPPATCTTHGVGIFTGTATCTTHGVDAPWRWRPAATTSAWDATRRTQSTPLSACGARAVGPSTPSTPMPLAGPLPRWAPMPPRSPPSWALLGT